MVGVLEACRVLQHHVRAVRSPESVESERLAVELTGGHHCDAPGRAAEANRVLAQVSASILVAQECGSTVTMKT